MSAAKVLPACGFVARETRQLQINSNSSIFDNIIIVLFCDNYFFMVMMNCVFCDIFQFPNLFSNKKVLLRERKRHTARRVARARYAALCNGGVP